MSSAAPADHASVVFRGRMMTLTVLELHTADIDAIRASVSEQIARAPDFFARMPVLLSLGEQTPDLGAVNDLLTDAELVVAGVLNPDEQGASDAARAGLGVVASPARGAEKASAPKGQAHREREPDAVVERAEATQRAGAARLVSGPVRSGQQIYARGGDLVVTGTVSAGAEVIADGHIHVYNGLRGRALAGASGDTGARIFARRFEPDLIAIAGCYKVAEAIDDAFRGAAVQVCFDEDNLTIKAQE